MRYSSTFLSGTICMHETLSIMHSFLAQGGGHGLRLILAMGACQAGLRLRVPRGNDDDVAVLRRQVAELRGEVVGLQESVGRLEEEARIQRTWHYELWNSRGALRSVMHIGPRHLPAMEHREGDNRLRYFVLVEPTFEDGTAPRGRLVLCPWTPYLVDADALARWRPLDAA